MTDGKTARDRLGLRGGEGNKEPGIRGSYDNRWDPRKNERDPYNDVIGDDDQQGPVDDDYIWPTVEENEDD